MQLCSIKCCRKSIYRRTLSRLPLCELFIAVKEPICFIHRKIFIQFKINAVAEKAFFNWSGGKDSALALHKAMLSNEYNIQCLLTNINGAHERVSMHGVRRSLMEAQA